MADINEPTAIFFVNTRLRPFADRRIQTYFEAKSLLLEFDSKDLAGVIKSSQDLIDDGAARDGRKPITAEDVFRLVEDARAFVKNFESDTDSAMLNGKVAVNYRG